MNKGNLSLNNFALTFESGCHVSLAEQTLRALISESNFRRALAIYAKHKPIPEIRS